MARADAVIAHSANRPHKLDVLHALHILFYFALLELPVYVGLGTLTDVDISLLVEEFSQRMVLKSYV